LGQDFNFFTLTCFFYRPGADVIEEVLTGPVVGKGEVIGTLLMAFPILTGARISDETDGFPTVQKKLPPYARQEACAPDMQPASAERGQIPPVPGLKNL
jgi:hypothetical protein